MSALTTDPTSLKSFSSAERVADGDFWSLTGAVTPAGHHVRLYLEKFGIIQILASRKDNFTSFFRDTSPGFTDGKQNQIRNLRPRNPAIAVNADGVYAMTWDNRDPEIGPDNPAEDQRAFGPSLGLAFSADGLEWVVYGNELGIEGLERIISETRSDNYPGEPPCVSKATGQFREVIPFFTDRATLRLFYRYEVRRSGACHTGTTAVPFCEGGTAVSN